MPPAQEFNRKAGEGAQAALGWSGPLQMAKSATASGPERQEAQASGVKRTMMTGLAAANAVMMFICSFPWPEYCSVIRGHAFLAGRSA
ncbi:hypothetical protein NKH16_33250 [Mesorhizobium sp. M1307]|uniref:hypothetical protein n=1 Tax=Mesorhizobium sp. M1307 TaxID=2957079 RepID=UPI0033354111